MASRIAQAIEDLRALAVKRRGPNAWHVDYPFAPWRRRAAAQERQDLLCRMLTDETIGAFLIDPVDREYLSDDIAIIESPSLEPSPWLFVRGEDVGRAFSDLYIGGWGLFLLNGIPGKPLPSPDALNIKETLVVGNLLEDVGAYACVLSWPDDIEWTIVVPIRRDE